MNKYKLTTSYSPEVMTSNIKLFGLLAQYVDQIPALKLDF